MTQQGIPSFEWTEDSLKVRQYLYEFWCERGHGPNFRDVHEALGLTRESIIAAYKQLALGEMVFDETSQNFFMLKVPPFSSLPSQVQLWIDDRFHSYIGCAMEAVGASRMPPFEDKDLRMESYCACCLEPITLMMKNGKRMSSTPDSVLIHVSSHPHEWGIPTVMPMCDSMNYVVDAHHADIYERKIGRRGVLFTIEQVGPLVSIVGGVRMWDYHWKAATLTGAAAFENCRSTGADLSNWDPAVAK